MKFNKHILSSGVRVHMSALLPWLPQLVWRSGRAFPASHPLWHLKIGLSSAWQLEKRAWLSAERLGERPAYYAY